VSQFSTDPASTPETELYYEYCLNSILDVRKVVSEIKEKNDLPEEHKQFTLSKLNDWEKYYLAEMARCKGILAYNLN